MYKHIHNRGFHMNTIQEMMNSYDWREAFTYADFAIDDVATILAESEGENDGDSWLAVGILKDGRYFLLTAWCDYTGWDCQAGGESYTSGTLDDLIRWSMTDDNRTRLGYTLPPETDGAPLPIIIEDCDTSLPE
jgi:hypothetical protein